MTGPQNADSVEHYPGCELDGCEARGHHLWIGDTLPDGWRLCMECGLPFLTGSLTKEMCMPCIIGKPRTEGPSWWQPEEQNDGSSPSTPRGR